MKKLIETKRKTFNTLVDIKNYLLERTEELKKLAKDSKHKNPIIFMGVSSIFDLLSYLPYDDIQMNKWKKKGNDLVSPRYIQFLNDYVFKNININNYNLGELFYQRVRCGLDHAFSTKNNEKVKVLLDHDINGKVEEVELEDLDGNKMFGIVFYALDIVNLLENAITIIFTNTNKISEQRIIKRFKDKHPLSSIYE